MFDTLVPPQEHYLVLLVVIYQHLDSGSDTFTESFQRCSCFLCYQMLMIGAKYLSVISQQVFQTD